MTVNVYITGINSKIWRYVNQNFNHYHPLQRYSEIKVGERCTGNNRLVILNDVVEEDIISFVSWCNTLNDKLAFDTVFVFSSEFVQYNDNKYTKRKLILEESLRSCFDQKLVIIRLPNLIFPGSRWSLYLDSFKKRKLIYLQRVKYNFRYLIESDIEQLFKDFSRESVSENFSLSIRNFGLDGRRQGNILTKIARLCLRNKRLRSLVLRFTPFFVIGGEEFILDEG